MFQFLSRRPTLYISTIEMNVFVTYLCYWAEGLCCIFLLLSWRSLLHISVIELKVLYIFLLSWRPMCLFYGFWDTKRYAYSTKILTPKRGLLSIFILVASRFTLKICIIEYLFPLAEITCWVIFLLNMVNYDHLRYAKCRFHSPFVKNVI